jgi:hypothetical protein
MPSAWAQEMPGERGGPAEPPPEEETGPKVPPKVKLLPEAKEEPEKEKRRFPEIDVRGEIEIEYVHTQQEKDSPAGETDRPPGYFQLDFAALDLRARLAENILGRFEARFTPEEPLDVQQAHLRVEDLPLGGFLKLGLTQRLMKPRRRTEVYPLAGAAFWKGQDIGVFAGIDWRFLRLPRTGEDAGDDLSLALVLEGSLTNGSPVGNRRIGEDRSFRIIGYEEQNGDANSSRQLGYQAGLKGKIADLLRFQVMTFGYRSRLSDDDLTFLSGVSGYGNQTSHRNYFVGGSAGLRLAGLRVYSQVCNGRVGLLGRAAWYVQGSYKLDLPRIEVGGTRVLEAVEPLVRYGVLDLDIEQDPSDSLTWDRDQWTLALLVDVVDGVELQVEYTINGEETGGSEVANDELVIQLEIQF